MGKLRANSEIISDKSKNPVTTSTYIKHGNQWLDDAVNNAIGAAASKADKTYVDSELTKKANKSDTDAALSSKADKSELSTKADKSALEAINASVSVNTSNIQELSTESTVLSARMDEFTKLEEGSTTGDAELADGRVGADGKTYDNIGGAIRGQVTDLKSDIKITSDFSVMDVSDDYVKTGKFYDRTTGNFKSESKGYYTDRISCSQKDVFYITARAQYECAMIVTYDSEGGRLRTLGFNSDSSKLIYEDYKFIPEANEKFVTFSSIYNTLIIKRNVGASIGTVVDKLNTNYGNDMDLVIQTTLNGDSIREDYIDGTYKITSFIGATITESLYGADGIVIKSKTTSITGNSISQSVN